MKTILAVVTASTAGLLLAAGHPVVDGVTLTHVGGTVEIQYALSGADAVVTVDFQTNVTGDAWASIGEENFRNLSGDVNRLVPAGDRSFKWKHVNQEWPGHRIAEGGFRAVVKAWDKAQPPAYMTVDLAAGAVRYYASTNALPGGFASDVYKKSTLLMRRIEAAGKTFQMGYGPNDFKSSYLSSEQPHFVTFTNDFYMAVYETTQAQFENLYRHVDPSYVYDGEFAGQGEKAPACGGGGGKVSYWYLRGWDNQVRWPRTGMAVGPDSICGKLRDLTQDGIFDLPTESQWEFACRAGTQTDFNNGHVLENDSIDPEVDKIAWNKNNCGGSVHEVGLLQPNAWMLYDMHGNVCELCRDVFVEKLSANHQIEPAGFNDEGSAAPNHNVRGGSYQYYLTNLTSARRIFGNGGNNVGFRLWADGAAIFGR